MLSCSQDLSCCVASKFPSALWRLMSSILLVGCCALLCLHAGAQQTGPITEQLVSSANGRAHALGGIGPNKVNKIVVLDADESTGAGMEVRDNSPAGSPTGTAYAVTVYADNILNAEYLTGAPTSAELEGYLTALLYHEGQHQCMNHTPMSPGVGSDSPDSCIHLAIDNAVHAAVCEYISTAMAPDCGGEHPEAIESHVLELLSGMCAEVKDIEDHWNSEEGIEKAILCICGDGDDTYFPVSGCSATLPLPHFPWPCTFNSQYPPIVPCLCCEALGF